MGKIKAFTLVEIMSVLVILGIVAVIMITISVKNAQRRETVTRFLLADSILEKLTQSSLIENGYPTLARNESAEFTFNKYFRPYLQIVKDCGTGAQYGDDRCFAGPGGGWFTLNNSRSSGEMYAYSSDAYYKVVLKNGMSMAFRTGPQGDAGSLYIVVDVNGPKKGYSKVGQDTFLFTYGYGKISCPNRKVDNAMLVPGKIDFWNCSDYLRLGRNAINTNVGGCTPTTGNEGDAPGGANCSIALLIDKKISNDYPWDFANQKPTEYSKTEASGVTYTYKYNSEGEIESYGTNIGGFPIDTCKYNRGKKTECSHTDKESGDTYIYKYKDNGITVESCKNKTTGESCSSAGYNPLKPESYRKAIDISGTKEGEPVKPNITVWKFENIYNPEHTWCEMYAVGVVDCHKYFQKYPL